MIDWNIVAMRIAGLFVSAMLIPLAAFCVWLALFDFLLNEEWSSLIFLPVAIGIAVAWKEIAWPSLTLGKIVREKYDWE